MALDILTPLSSGLVSFYGSLPILRTCLFCVALTHLGLANVCKSEGWGSVASGIFHFCGEESDPHCSKCPINYLQCERGDCKVCMNRDQANTHFMNTYNIKSCRKHSSDTHVIVISINDLSKSYEEGVFRKVWKQWTHASCITNVNYEKQPNTETVLFRAKKSLGFECEQTYSYCRDHLDQSNTERIDLLSELKGIASCMKCLMPKNPPGQKEEKFIWSQRNDVNNGRDKCADSLGKNNDNSLDDTNISESPADTGHLGLILGSSLGAFCVILVLVLTLVLMKRRRGTKVNQRKSKDVNPIYGPRETVYVDEVIDRNNEDYGMYEPGRARATDNNSLYEED